MKKMNLMVGDFVLHNGKVKRVDVIWGRQVSLYDRDKTYGSIYADKYPIEELKPIPLTPEILQKNGWHEEDNRRGTLILDVTKPMAGDGFECQWMRCNVSTMTSTLVFNFVTATAAGTIACKYVHELQNIIRDIDFNKEIEL